MNTNTIRKIGFFFGTALLAVTLQASAQKSTHKYVIITNGDTIINGKHLDKVTPEERKILLNDFPNVKNGVVEIGGTGIIVERNLGDSLTRSRYRLARPRVFIRDSLVTSFNHDSLRSHIYARIDSLSGGRIRVLRPDHDYSVMMPNMIRPARPGVRVEEIPSIRSNGHNLLRPSLDFDESNSQSFSYRNTDKDGYTSTMTFRIGDAKKDVVNKITGSTTAKTTLEAEDLTLFPHFSSGKTTVSFTLAGKGATEVKILDSDLKPVFTEKLAAFSGSYTKQVSLPRNGIHYLAVNQNGNWMVKRVVKSN